MDENLCCFDSIIANEVFLYFCHGETSALSLIQNIYRVMETFICHPSSFDLASLYVNIELDWREGKGARGDDFLRTAAHPIWPYLSYMLGNRDVKLKRVAIVLQMMDSYNHRLTPGDISTFKSIVWDNLEYLKVSNLNLSLEVLPVRC
jgi:hypothetical protein